MDDMAELLDAAIEGDAAALALLNLLAVRVPPEDGGLVDENDAYLRDERFAYLKE